MSTHFFKEIPGFHDFAEATDPRHYHAVPEDWSVVLTDVQGSTKAIEAGRYKEVNMVGAACITAAVNACGEVPIPYVFGGDGATILVPPARAEQVVGALLAVRRAALAAHELTLRVGVVPVAEILKRGKHLSVAKYVLPTGFGLAMLRGGGANLADELVKRGGYALEVEEKGPPPDLRGLSCRWQPLASRHGTMLTLLVMETAPEEGKHLYESINKFIAQTLDKDGGHPVHLRNLRYRWPGPALLRQSRMVWKQGNRLRNLGSEVGMTALFHVLHRFNLKLGNFDVTAYRRDMIANADDRKFDDMLRMVVDCTRAQAQTIEEHLARLHEAGRIAYGLHYSDKALMTCFVATTEGDGHVHFIDGDGGGYALAAKQLKEQLARGVRPPLQRNIQPCPFL